MSGCQWACTHVAMYKMWIIYWNSSLGLTLRLTSTKEALHFAKRTGWTSDKLLWSASTSNWQSCASFTTISFVNISSSLLIAYTWLRCSRMYLNSELRWPWFGWLRWNCCVCLIMTKLLTSLIGGGSSYACRYAEFLSIEEECVPVPKRNLGSCL